MFYELLLSLIIITCYAVRSACVCMWGFVHGNVMIFILWKFSSSFLLHFTLSFGERQTLIKNLYFESSAVLSHKSSSNGFWAEKLLCSIKLDQSLSWKTKKQFFAYSRPQNAVIKTLPACCENKYFERRFFIIMQRERFWWHRKMTADVIELIIWQPARNRIFALD